MSKFTTCNECETPLACTTRRRCPFANQATPMHAGLAYAEAELERLVKERIKEDEEGC